MTTPTTPSLPAFVEDLGQVPPQLHGFYDRSGGGYKLRLSRVDPIDPIPAAPPAFAKMTSAQRAARRDAERDRLVDIAVARLRPKPEARDALAANLRDRIRIDEDADGGMHPAFLHEPRGLRLPSGAPGRDWCDFDEFVSRPDLHEQHSEWFQPPPQPTEVPSEEFKVPVRDVTITRTQAANLRNYEDARNLARSRGGQLRIVDDPAGSVPPSESPVPDGKNVLLTRAEANDFTRYERANELARSRGGRVVISDPPTQVPDPS